MPNAERIFYIRHAFRAGYTVERIFELTKIDPWFLEEFRQLVAFEDTLCTYARLEDLPRETLFEAKRLGYSDAQRADLAETIARCSAEIIVDASPAGIEHVYRGSVPIVRVTYPFAQRRGRDLGEIVDACGLQPLQPAKTVQQPLAALRPDAVHCIEHRPRPARGRAGPERGLQSF